MPHCSVCRAQTWRHGGVRMAPPVSEVPSAFIIVFTGQDKGRTEFGAVPVMTEFHFVTVCRKCAAILGQLTALALTHRIWFWNTREAGAVRSQDHGTTMRAACGNCEITQTLTMIKVRPGLIWGSDAGCLCVNGCWLTFNGTYDHLICVSQDSFLLSPDQKPIKLKFNSITAGNLYFPSWWPSTSPETPP